MKNALPFVLFAFVLRLSLSAAPAPELVYRAAITTVGGDSSSPRERTVNVTFRVYESESSSAPAWQMTRPVTVGTTGAFQSAFADGLSDATYPAGNLPFAQLVAQGKANWVGIAVDGGRELLPRRAVLSVPKVERAVSASAFADDATVNVANAKTAEVGTLSVSSSLTVSGNFVHDAANEQIGTVVVTADVPAEWKTIQMRAKKARVFRRGAPIDAGVQTVPEQSYSSVRLEWDRVVDGPCVAVFVSLDSNSMPGAAAFFVNDRPWISIYPGNGGTPKAGERIRCWIWPLGAE